MKLLGILSGLTAAAIWGGMYVVSNVVLQIIPAFPLLSLRLLIGIAVLLPIAYYQKQLHYTPAQLKKLLGIGVVGYGISLGLQFIGTQLSTASNGALITSASPAFIVLFAFLILREQLNLVRVFALILATIGVVVVVFDPAQLNLNFWGNAALVGAAVTWGLYSVLVKWATTQGMPTLSITVMALVGGLPLALPMSLTQTVKYAQIDLGVVLGVLYLGIISTALAMFLWNKSFELLEASTASLLFFAQPVVGVALGAWLLGDALGVNFFLGGAMILLGVLLTTLNTQNSKLNS